MKKYILLLAGLLFMFASCSDGGNDVPEKEQPEETPREEAASITCSTTSLSMGYEGGEKTLNFTANKNWTISVANGISWCTISQTAGAAGTFNVSIKFTENQEYDDRNVTITIKCDNASHSIVLTQKQKEAMLITTNKYEIDKEGGTIEVEVKANIDYQLEISETAKDWIKESASRALKSYKHTFKIETSEEYDKRKGEIYVKSGNKRDTIRIYQSGDAILMLSQNEHTVNDKGEIISVDIKSNFEYGVQMPNVDWIQEENSSRGVSSHTLKYIIAANGGYNSRSAEIIFYDKNSTLKDTLKVVQYPKGTIVLKAPGSLSDYINENEKYEIKSLTIFGDLNGTDIRFIREMAGSDVQGESTNGKLEFLNISKSNIIEGGDAYIFSNYSSYRIVGPRMFQSCSSLKELYLPETTTEIDEYAFSNCTQLKVFQIPQKVTTLGTEILKGCISLDTLTIPRNIKSWGAIGQTSIKSVVIESGVTYIPYKAFYECEKLKKMVIPKSVKSISNEFIRNGSLKELYVDDLEQWLSYGWNSPFKVPFPISWNNLEETGTLYIDGEKIKEIIIPDSYTSIPEYAFYGCGNIESIILPNSIVEIKKNAFLGTGIQNITIPNSVRTIGEYAFSHCLNLENVKMSNMVTNIPDACFQNCRKLKFSIPNYIQDFGYDAFLYCESLDEITIPEGVVRLGSSSIFAGCINVKTIILPTTLEYIGPSVFGNVPVNTVYCYAVTPPIFSIYSSGDTVTFDSVDKKTAKLYVPKGSVETYKSSEWGEYFDNITEMEE